MHNRLFRVLALVAALAMLALAACGGSTGGQEGSGGTSGGSSDGGTTDQGSDSAASSEPIKLGIVLPTSGDLGFLGGPMTNAALLAVDVINEAGGLLGGRMVEGIPADSRTEETAAREAADKVINVDGVPALVGAAGSGISFAVLAVAEQAQVVMISPSSTSPDFTTQDEGNWFFRTAPSDSLQGAVMAKYASEQGYTKAATLALNNAYGEGFKNVFIETFESMGGEVVADVLYDPQGTTFTSEVEQIVSSGAEVVILVGYPETGSAILKEAYARGSFDNQVWLLSEGLRTPELPDLVGRDADGNYVLAGIQGTSPISTGPAFDDFAQRFEAKYGSRPEGPFDAHTYDAMILLALAIEQAGKAEGPAIRDALIQVAAPPGQQVSTVAEGLELIRSGQDIDYEGASGNVNFDEVGDVLATYAVWEITPEGEIVDVTEVAP
ncbi:MAG TPA: ABC transporter substrate-binding protein [Bacillota bacterium]